MTKTIPFSEWKSNYVPKVYEDTGAWCDEHSEANTANPENWCECEFLYTLELGDLVDEEDEWNLHLAIEEKRIWTWDNRGIRSGVDFTEPWADLLVTLKPWEEPLEVSND